MPRVPVSGSMHAQPQPDESDYTTCVARQRRAHRRTTINGKRQTDLSAPQGDSGTQLCGCETITRPSLRALSRVAPREWAMFIGGCVPEYEEDSAVDGAIVYFTAGINAHHCVVVRDGPFFPGKLADRQESFKKQQHPASLLKNKTPFFRMGFVSDLRSIGSSFYLCGLWVVTIFSETQSVRQ